MEALSMSEPFPPVSTENRGLPDRVWIGKDDIGLLFYGVKRPEIGEPIEYMRVLSRKEVEKLASDWQEGADVQQYINSLVRTIEGQKRHIATLESQLNNAINELTARSLNG